MIALGVPGTTWTPDPTVLTRDQARAALYVTDSILEHACGCEIHKATGEGKLLPYEKELVELLFVQWGKASKKAMDAAVKLVMQNHGEFSELEAQSIIAEISKQINASLLPGVQKQMPGLFGSGYKLSKKTVAAQLKHAPTFGVADQVAVKWLSDHHLYWVGTYFDKNLSSQFAADVAAGMKQGLGRAAIGNRMADFFNEYPGVTAKPDSYWRGLAANGMNRSRNFGQLAEYEDVAVKYMQVVAVMDERTSPICFDGSTRVQTAGGVKTIDQIHSGEILLTGSGKWRQIKAVSSRISHSWVILGLSSGRLLTVTPEHPIMTDDGWKPAGAICEGERLVTQEVCDETLRDLREPRTSGSKGQNSPILLGAMLSEGKIEGGLDNANLLSLREEIPGATMLCAGREDATLQHGMPPKEWPTGHKSSSAYAHLQDLRKKISHQTHRISDRKDQKALLSHMPTTSRRNDLSGLRKGIRVCFSRIWSPQVLLARLLSAFAMGIESRIVASGSIQRIWRRISEGSSDWPIFHRLCLAETECGGGGGWQLLAYQEYGIHDAANRQGTQGRVDRQGRICSVPSIAGESQKRCGESSPEEYIRLSTGSVKIVSVKRHQLSVGRPAYNLEIDDDPTYTAEGVVVHNCRLMNGKVIPVASAVSQRNLLMAATDPEDVKSIAPWVSASALSGMSTNDIVNQGVIMPPYHFNCRTTVVAYFQTAKSFTGMRITA